MQHIFLYGPPGSGKTTVGKILADSLGLPFIDLDTRIEATAGQPISEIMRSSGEETFRDLETAALQQAASDPASVVSLGGGALLRPMNRACAESAGQVIVLEADLATLLARVNSGGDSRPLLAGDMENRLRVLMAARQAHYNSFQLRVANHSRPASETADAIQITIGRFSLRQGRGEYTYVIERSGLDRLPDWIGRWQFTGRLAIVTDSNVGPIYVQLAQNSLAKAGLASQIITIPAGEANKTLETVASLWHSFLQMGLDRKSLVLALGGGVVGDLAGFAASTYMRGITWVGLPTSLLAMVDSSLGGKTGFDLPYGKNLVGSFYPPRFVLADPQVLSTLPAIEFRSGLGEVMKHAIIADPRLFEIGLGGVDSVHTHLDEVIRRAVAVKVRIIQADPYEEGWRAALNYGHTVGHAVELVSGFRLRHGEAVSIGMVAEARLAECLSLAREGLAAEISSLLTGLGLPTEIPADLPKDALIRSMQVDKKKHAGKVRFALPVEIGEVKVGVELDDLELVFKEG